MRVDSPAVRIYRVVVAVSSMGSEIGAANRGVPFATIRPAIRSARAANLPVNRCP